MPSRLQALWGRAGLGGHGAVAAVRRMDSAPPCRPTRRSTRASRMHGLRPLRPAGWPVSLGHVFDSAAGGVVPICALAALVGVGCAFLPRWWLAALLAIVVPVGIGYAWFWLPWLITQRPHVDPLRPWDLIATTYWSMFAVPTSLAAMFLARLVRARRGRSVA